MADRALGMIETRGLVASIEAADAMVKAAKVRLLSKEKVQGGLVTILIVGETAAVKSAIDAGAAAAQRVGELISTHIIPRPDNQIDEIVKGIETSGEESKQEIKITLEKRAERKTVTRRVKEIELEEEVKPVFKSTSSSTIDRLKQEALGETASPDSEKVTTGSIAKQSFSMKELEVMNVHQLRRFARDIEEFPIKGREISRANRGELLDFFKALLK
jgi:ethanolamine utilization protein EutM